MENENIRGKMMYYSCVYSGISNKIHFEMKYGTDDITEEEYQRINHLRYLILENYNIH